MTEQTYEGWAILEIMGHRQRAGRVTMDEGPLVRIDIPVGEKDDAGEEKCVTEYYGRAALFSMRPCTEEIARTSIERYADPRPVRPVDYRSPARDALPDYSDSDEEQYDDLEGGF